MILSTHPATLCKLMRGQLKFLRERAVEVIAVAAPGPELDEVARREGVQTVGVPMERAIRPLGDLRSLLALYRVVRDLRPDIVQAGTAKAGLLGMLAAVAARVPVRVYLLRGVRAERLTGFRSWLLRRLEWIAARCATRIHCVSPSLAQLYIEQRFAPPEQIVVLGSGSSNGVDHEHYLPRSRDPDAAARLRKQLGIEPDAPVIGFVGRVVRDKGVGELLAAFDKVCERLPAARMLMLGEAEMEDRIAPRHERRIQRDERIVALGAVPDAAPYYAVMDVLAFPSFREGFPNVPLEAASAEVPVVAFRATGSVDAVADAVTGRIVEKGNVGELAEGLLAYLLDPALRQEHGRAGRERVLREFRQEPLWEAIHADYMELHQRARQSAAKRETVASR